MKTALFTTGLLGIWLLAKGGPPPSSAGVDLQWDYDFEGNTNAASIVTGAKGAAMLLEDAEK